MLFQLKYGSQVAFLPAETIKFLVYVYDKAEYITQQFTYSHHIQLNWLLYCQDKFVVFIKT
jgi:hypothetical protein